MCLLSHCLILVTVGCDEFADVPRVWAVGGRDQHVPLCPEPPQLYLWPLSDVPTRLVSWGPLVTDSDQDPLLTLGAVSSRHSRGLSHSPQKGHPLLKTLCDSPLLFAQNPHSWAPLMGLHGCLALSTHHPAAPPRAPTALLAFLLL